MITVCVNNEMRKKNAFLCSSCGYNKEKWLMKSHVLIANK
jgi:hypothetical protein